MRDELLALFLLALLILQMLILWYWREGVATWRGRVAMARRERDRWVEAARELCSDREEAL